MVFKLFEFSVVVFNESRSYKIFLSDNFLYCIFPEFFHCIKVTPLICNYCLISFDVICHTDYWDLGDYRIRPLKIIGYLDGILNECKLSGLGTLNFMGCNEIVISEELSGYCLTYAAVHGSDDFIPEAGDPDNGK